MCIKKFKKNPHFRAIPLLLMSGRKDEVTDKIPEPFEYFAFLEKTFRPKTVGTRYSGFHGKI